LTYPDQVCVEDIAYVALQQEFVYMAVIMDMYTRAIRRWLDREFPLTALDEWVLLNHHSDQAVQYAYWGYTELLLNRGVRISSVWPLSARQRKWLCQAVDARDFHDVYLHLRRSLDDVYTRKRIHSALGYLMLAEFEAQWLYQRAAQATAQ
jgi:putative transposase